MHAAGIAVDLVLVANEHDALELHVVNRCRLHREVARRMGPLNDKATGVDGHQRAEMLVANAQDGHTDSDLIHVIRNYSRLWAAFCRLPDNWIMAPRRCLGVGSISEHWIAGSTCSTA